MKRLIKLLCLILGIVMVLSMFAACSSSSNIGITVGTHDGNTDSSQNGGEGNKDENRPGEDENDDQTGGNEGGLPILPQPDVASFDSTYYVGYVSIIRREYDADGRVIRELIFNDEEVFLYDERIEYYYDESGKLIRSDMLCRDYEMDDFTDANFHLESYMLYSYDESGRSASAVMYDEYGRKQNITATLEYYDSGKPKKIVYYEDGEHEYTFEYDESGRCVKEYKGLVVVTRNYEGDSRNLVSAVANYNDETQAVYMSFVFAYDSEGRTNYIEATSGDRKTFLAMEYLTEAEGGHLKHQEVSYSANDRTIITTMEYTAEGYAKKIDLDAYWGKVDVEVEYYPCGVVKQRVYKNDNETDIDKYEIDANNNIIKHTEEEYSDNVLEQYFIRTYEYDPKNNCVKDIFNRYDAQGAVKEKYVSEYEYDSKGMETKDTEYRYGNDDVLDSVSIEYATEYLEDGTKREKSENIRYENGKPSGRGISVYDRDSRGNYIYREYVNYVFDEIGNQKFSSRSEEYTEYGEHGIVKTRTLTWYDESKYLAGVIEDERIGEHIYDQNGREIKSTDKHMKNGKLTSEYETVDTYDTDGNRTGYTNYNVSYYENGKMRNQSTTEYKIVSITEDNMTTTYTLAVSQTVIEYREDGSIYQKEENGYGEGGVEWEPTQRLYTYYDENGAITGSRLYEYEYDPNEMGNIIKSTCTEYDANGNVIGSW